MQPWIGKIFSGKQSNKKMNSGLHSIQKYICFIYLFSYYYIIIIILLLIYL